MLVHYSAASALTQRDEAYLWVGVELFPVVIKSIETPINTGQPIVILYQDTIQQTQTAATELKNLLQNPVIEMQLEEFLKTTDIYAVFIADPDLLTPDVIQHSLKHQFLTFSPFYQALTQKVDTGLMIREQVRPHVNVKQAQRKQIIFKPFFLRVSEIYE